jgi:2-polyprenyl-3-methyl-5-hydroxy-6-metoxy-1,4-benzoquinol methylase
MAHQPIGRVLDVGCAAGGNAPVLRERGATSLIGIEINKEAAIRAEKEFDIVYARPVEVVLPDLLSGSIDTIICGDILEHLVDPWSVLRELRRCAAPGAQLLTSIPNFRNYRIFVNLALRGTLGYGQQGLMDVTHLRFFTKRDIRRILSDTGWCPTTWDFNKGSRGARLARPLQGTIFHEFLVVQWYICARPA